MHLPVTVFTLYPRVPHVAPGNRVSSCKWSWSELCAWFHSESIFSETPAEKSQSVQISRPTEEAESSPEKNWIDQLRQRLNVEKKNIFWERRKGLTYEPAFRKLPVKHLGEFWDVFQALVGRGTIAWWTYEGAADRIVKKRKAFRSTSCSLEVQCWATKPVTLTFKCDFQNNKGDYHNKNSCKIIRTPHACKCYKEEWFFFLSVVQVCACTQKPRPYPSRRCPPTCTARALSTGLASAPPKADCNGYLRTCLLLNRLWMNALMTAIKISSSTPRSGRESIGLLCMFQFPNSKGPLQTGKRSVAHLDTLNTTNSPFRQNKIKIVSLKRTEWIQMLQSCTLPKRDFSQRGWQEVCLVL